MKKTLIGEVSRNNARELVKSWGFTRLPRKNIEAVTVRAIRDPKPSESVANLDGKYYHYEYEKRKD